MIDSAVAAWWGAIIATVVLVWDVVKWSRDKPRVRISTRMPVAYWNSESIEETTLDGKVVEKLNSYCHVEIINRGNIPTTIVSVCCSNKPGEGKVEHGNHDIVIHDGNRLPHVLGAGQLWSCRIPESGVKNISRQHKDAYVKVRLSHRDGFIYAKVKES